MKADRSSSRGWAAQIVALVVAAVSLIGACSAVSPERDGSPETPMTPVLSSMATHATSATVSWTAPDTNLVVSGYELRWRLDSDSASDSTWDSAEVASSETTYRIGGLHPNTTYRNTGARRVYGRCGRLVGAAERNHRDDTDGGPDGGADGCYHRDGNDDIRHRWLDAADDDSRSPSLRAALEAQHRERLARRCRQYFIDRIEPYHPRPGSGYRIRRSGARRVRRRRWGVVAAADRKNRCRRVHPATGATDDSNADACCRGGRADVRDRNVDVAADDSRSPSL